jgi:hypothetical protein
MSKFRCKSCGGTYSDRTPEGGAYFHVCPPEIITHAVTSTDGKVVTEEKRVQRANARNESPRAGISHFEGKWQREVPDPETPGRLLTQDAEYGIVSEGAGRELVE